MELQLRIIHASDFLKASPSGDLDLEKSKQIMQSLADANRPPADRDILLDLRGATGPNIELARVADIVRVMVENLASFQRKMAMLIPPDAPGDRAALLEQLADRRGFNVEVFRDFEQAINWLIGSTPVSAPTAIHA